ncbi:MAG: sigma-54 dependent transcriptional regulator [Bacteroidetes bacterium]|nr:sigma-54 dependent transcriptional regulator [Bacteroidota bacterium]
MSNVLIVTTRESKEYPFERISTDTIRCRVVPPTEAESTFSAPVASRPDLLVIDLESIQPPAGQFVERLSRMNPEAGLIVLAGSESFLSSTISMQFAIDEVVPWPKDDSSLQSTVKELGRRIALHDRLRSVQEKLLKEMHQQHIVVRSDSMRELISCLPQLAETPSTILITGETGTGKELIARAIHYLGPRAGRPFITVDCGTIPESLVENELFGHARGAYTDAAGGFKGLIQEADGGTLFLDEVESIPLSVQTKLLRFLQERQYKPLGQSSYVNVDVHVVAATNVNLEAHVERRLFRDDLYYRLKVIPLTIPPLRERRVDIPCLVRFFLRRYAGDRRTAVDIAPEILRQWIEYDWPGNVRELENKIQEWLMMTDAGAHFAPTRSTQTADLVCTLSEIRREALARSEEKYFRHLMSITNGNVSAAARLARVDRKNLRRLLAKYSIDPEPFRPKR